MSALLIAILCFGTGAMGALVFANRGRGSTICGVSGILIGCVCGIIPTVSVVLGEPSQSLRMEREVPYRSLFLYFDPPSGFFLSPVFIRCALGAIYGAVYLVPYPVRKALAVPWFFF